MAVAGPTPPPRATPRTPGKRPAPPWRSRTLPGRGADRLVVREDAELVVGDRLGLARADRAVRVAADLELGRRRGQRVVDQQAADERVADADHELDDLRRLQQAHRA